MRLGRRRHGAGPGFAGLYWTQCDRTADRAAHRAPDEGRRRERRRRRHRGTRRASAARRSSICRRARRGGAVLFAASRSRHARAGQRAGRGLAVKMAFAAWTKGKLRAAARGRALAHAARGDRGPVHAWSRFAPDLAALGGDRQRTAPKAWRFVARCRRWPPRSPRPPAAGFCEAAAEIYARLSNFKGSGCSGESGSSAARACAARSRAARNGAIAMTRATATSA